MGTDNANKDRQAIDLLFAERCSCVVRNGDTIRIFRERGVRDLWRLLHEEPELLDGAFVADKVVGKGAAALMAAGRVRELFADVVSHAALELLNGAGIPVSYTVAVPHHQPRRRRHLSRGAALRRSADRRGVPAADRRVSDGQQGRALIPAKGGKNRPQPSSASLRRGRPKNKSNTEQ